MANHDSHRGVAVMLALGVVFFALGAKLGLIHFFGTDQPFADQWAAEGVGFLRAPLHEKLNGASFFWPHGEHRPAITRLLTYFFISGNRGQWDCFVEIVGNLAIYAAFLVVACRLASRVTRGAWTVALAVFMALLFAQPSAYENFLWGFQSQFLFLLFTGLVHVTGTLFASRPGWTWGAAQLVGFAGLFSIAAGVMSAATLIAVAALALLRGRRDAWAWATLVFNLALFAFGVWLLPPSLSDGVSHFSTLAGAAVRTGYLLVWPLSGLGWLPLCWAPCLGLAFSLLRRDAADKNSGVVVAVGLWIFLMAFAVGYGRGITPDTIGVRYYDILIVGVFANALALVGMLQGTKRGGPVFWRGLGVAWALVMAIGLWHYNNPERAGATLRFGRQIALEQAQVIRRFLVSNDTTELQAFANRTQRFPHFSLTLDLLRDPQAQPLLPPSLSTDHRVGPLSKLAPLVAAAWAVLMGTGTLLLIFGGIWGMRGGGVRVAPVDPTILG